MPKLKLIEGGMSPKAGDTFLVSVGVLLVALAVIAIAKRSKQNDIRRDAEVPGVVPESRYSSRGAVFELIGGGK